MMEGENKTPSAEISSDRLRAIAFSCLFETADNPMASRDELEDQLGI